MDFTGKVVLVTGASRGIGRVCAKLFAERGAKVAVHYNRNQDGAQTTVESLDGDGHIIVQADVSDPDAVKAAVDGVVGQMSKLDVLVNNAGIFESHPITEVSYAQWQATWTRTLATNLTGAANMAYCAAQHMIAGGGGRIINVSSRGAFRGEPTAPAYGASKAGMNALGQSLAVALAPHHIGVMTVAPGWVATDMAAEELENPSRGDIRKQSPFNRVASPEEVAGAVLYFASDDALFASGAILDVNGASYLRT